MNVRFNVIGREHVLTRKISSTAGAAIGIACNSLSPAVFAETQVGPRKNHALGPFAAGLSSFISSPAITLSLRRTTDFAVSWHALVFHV